MLYARLLDTLEYNHDEKNPLGTANSSKNNLKYFGISKIVFGLRRVSVSVWLTQWLEIEPKYSHLVTKWDIFTATFNHCDCGLVD